VLFPAVAEVVLQIDLGSALMRIRPLEGMLDGLK
jgi:hypothetical protein